jgi:hypothetical protein
VRIPCELAETEIVSMVSPSCSMTCSRLPYDLGADPCIAQLRTQAHHAVADESRRGSAPDTYRSALSGAACQDVDEELDASHRVDDSSHTGWKLAERRSSVLRATSAAMKRASSSGVSAMASIPRSAIQPQLTGIPWS